MQATGNISGLGAEHPHLSFRSGLIFPSGIRDPYVYSYFLGIQHELVNRLVLRVNYVGYHRTQAVPRGRHQPHSGRQAAGGACVTDTFGRSLCGQKDNTAYPGTTVARTRWAREPELRPVARWLNVNNSNYNSLQASLKRQAVHGLALNIATPTVTPSTTGRRGTTMPPPETAPVQVTATPPDFHDSGSRPWQLHLRCPAPPGPNYVYELPRPQCHRFCGRNRQGMAMEWNRVRPDRCALGAIHMPRQAP